MSGARKALRRDSNTGQASSPEGRSVSFAAVVASSDAARRRAGIGRAARRPWRRRRRRVRIGRGLGGLRRAFALLSVGALADAALAAVALPRLAAGSASSRSARSRRSRRAPRPRLRPRQLRARLRVGLRLALGGVGRSVALASAVSGVTPSAASGVVGTSRTLTLPPAASIFARADAVNASATTKSGTRQLAGAEDLERLVQGPDEPDGAQDVLVDRDLAAALARLLGGASDARTRRARRARRWRRRSRPRTRS